jgi:orotate phosphoribosyltransferase
MEQNMEHPKDSNTQTAKPPIRPDHYKQQFIREMMECGALKFGDFTTKSGRQSPYFINTGAFNTGSRIDRLSACYAACIVEQMESGKLPKDLDVLFGPAYKGIPLAATVAVALSRTYGIDLGYVFNRKEAKDHGEGGALVGKKLADGDRVLILDDVITAGTAIRETMPVVRAAADVSIVGLVISVDRMERGQGENTAVEEVRRDLSIDVFPLVTIKDILTEVEDVHKVAIQNYMARYCVL